MCTCIALIKNFIRMDDNVAAEAEDGMLSVILTHYARYRNKKARRVKSGPREGCDTTSATHYEGSDSIYCTSINGRYKVYILDKGLIYFLVFL